MNWLYQKLETLREIGAIKEVPQYVKDNLNPHFEHRPYQEDALSNFITYYENPKLHTGKNIHTLFHMATGSGKTYIMSGLIIYLYKQGYRNFLFFVNLSQIVKKTIDNFSNQQSSKYLFAPIINIDGKNIKIREVSNFQDCNPDDINILFSTTAGLHSDLTLIKENKPSFEDFLQDKTVLIADEAHHLNTNTKDKAEEENEHHWETTVNKIRESNPENIMLEFTATCDVTNPSIAEKYQDKIVFDYGLAKFREDKYSKDIFMLRSDFDQSDEGRLLRCLQALVLSQYKLKLFLDNKLNVKPVILFKSKTIKESQKNKELLIDYIKNLSETTIRQLKEASSNDELLNQVFAYYNSKGISDEMLADELKLAFSSDVFIDVNDDKELEKNQILVNSLEDESNPYRVIFEVEKLDEGWDCLNLFDIVRLYETRDAGKNSKPGKSTVREAQLIGRGSRYFPFQLDESQDKYKRKFDADVTNPLRICEQLHYHCQNNSKYISELRSALRDQGIDDENRVLRHNDIKEEFKKDDLYKNGFVFLNSQVGKQFSKISDISELPSEIIVNFSSGRVGETQLMVEHGIETYENPKVDKQYSIRKTLKQLVKEYGYNIVHSEISRFQIFTFESLKELFPKLDSVKEFLTSDEYLGNITVVLNGNKEVPDFFDWGKAIRNAISKISMELSVEKQSCVGSSEFRPVPLSSVFKREGTNRYYTNPKDDGEGVPQRSCSPALQFDTDSVDWYVYKDNFGTTEEKKFVKYFATWVTELKQKYDVVKLIRNECQAAIYSFNDGRKFEPDFLLYLKNKQGDYEYSQLFIEPKGHQLLLQDSWKEEFLLELKNKAIPIVQYKNDSKYLIWGLHFYSSPDRDEDFKKDMEALISDD